MDRSLLGPALLLLAACKGPEGDPDSGASSLTPPGTPTPASCAPGVAAINGTATYPTVGQALAEASRDDEVRICDGDWEVDLAAGTGSITVVGDSADAALVTLRPAPGRGTVLQFFSSDRISLAHLTLTGATTSAVSVATTALLDVRSCIFRENTGDLGGGAIAAQIRRDPTVATAMLVADCTFEDNTAPRGGAIELAPSDGATMRIEDSSFTANTATSAGGGAIWVLPTAGSGNRLELERVSFQGNHATRDGGAVAVTGPAIVHWGDCQATANTAENAGAAYALLPPVDGGDGTATMVGGRLAQNIADSVLSGAIHLEPGWTLDADQVDLASGAEDNEPKDVNVCGQFDDVVSFTVGPGGCQ